MSRRRRWSCCSFVGIEHQANQYARNLPYGQQRRLEIARALATDPKLLLLDEPAAGFTPQEKVELMGLVEKILGRGITVFLIEHDMKVVMGISQRIVVLDHGEKIAEGAARRGPQEPARDRSVPGKVGLADGAPRARVGSTRSTGASRRCAA